jgi:hypothetical protein
MLHNATENIHKIKLPLKQPNYKNIKNSIFLDQNSSSQKLVEGKSYFHYKLDKTNQ